ncbi:low temperature requirement protein A [Nonomuraea sp. NPDC050691]|uniref:low temperature requirement protein A n=1 Tax=Nonomuraea sp. NPDC050691 TaxID=3155661 RepID=UPI0033C9E2A9
MRLPSWFADRAEPDAPAETEIKVSTLELFFDLVFVFTITQLTALLTDGLDWESALRVVLVFGVQWWMYSGYVWLTNAIPPVRPARRILVLLGMTGFLIMALAIPTVFEGGFAFAIGYLLLILVHAGLYLQSTAAFSRVVPYNLAGTALIAAASLFDGPWNYVLWAAAVVLLYGSPYFIGQKGFPLKPGHIVERHGLLVIIALGESMLAIGIGAHGQADLPTLVAAVLGMALAACLWWWYFGGDDEVGAEHALAASDPERRTKLILRVYFYGHVLILLGVLGIAAGIKKVIDEPLAGLKPGAAVVLAVGAVLFLAGHSWFRRSLGLADSPLRPAAAGLAAVSAALGLWSATAQLAMLVVVLAGVLAVESRHDMARKLPS